MSAKKISFNFTKNPDTQCILELIGWLVCVILPINIALRIGYYVQEYTPRWVQWLVVLMMLGALLFWSILWLGYGVRRVTPKIPRLDAEIEAWFRTQLVDSPSNWNIAVIESSSFIGESEASAKIGIDDGHGSIVVLDCDLGTKRLRGCRAYPKQESPQETSPSDRSGVKPRDEITQALNSLITKLTKEKGDQSGGSR